MWVLVWGVMFFEVASRIDHGTGFEQQDIDAEVRQDLDHRPPTRAGADHDDIVYRTAALYLHDDLG